MTDAANPSFVVPRLAHLVKALREFVDSNGGPTEVFDALTKGPDEMRKFGSGSPALRRLLLRLIDEAQFRSAALEALGAGDDRSYLESVFRGLEAWRYTAKTQFEYVRLVLMGSLREMLGGPIPFIANDFRNCQSDLFLDAASNELRARAVIKLAEPDKSIGGPNGLVLAGAVADFLIDADILLSSLLLDDDEVELLKISGPIKEELLGGLSRIEKTVESLRKQFERMHRS